LNFALRQYHNENKFFHEVASGRPPSHLSEKLILKAAGLVPGA